MLHTNSDERINSRRGQRTARRYFTMLMALVYIGLGTFLIVAPPGIFVLALTTRRIVGGLFILYGLLRFVREFRQHFRKRHDTF
jgi:hypothetical protein